MSETIADHAAAAAQDKPIPWDIYMQLMDEYRRPGWSYGRFAIQSEAGQALFMFGHLRGSFGVFCRVGMIIHDGVDTTPARLFHIVALRMGMIVATFINAQQAMEGCEIAEAMADWDAFREESEPAYKLAVERTSLGWASAALYAFPNMTARAGDGHEIPQMIVKQPEYLTEHRPEKLS